MFRSPALAGLFLGSSFMQTLAADLARNLMILVK
jgi:hypothetical protein